MRISDWSSDVCSSDLAPTRSHFAATIRDKANSVNMVEMTCPLPLPRHPGEGRDDNMGSTLPVVSVGQRTFLRGFVTLAQAVLPRRQRLRLEIGRAHV